LQLYPLSLHDALPIYVDRLDVVDGLATLEAFDDRELVLVAADQLGELDHRLLALRRMPPRPGPGLEGFPRLADGPIDIRLRAGRSEEHTSELQSLTNI